MKMEKEEKQITLFDLDSSFGKMSQAPFRQQKEKISGRSLKKQQELQMAPYQYLDLRKGYGNLLGAYWDINSPLLGEYSMLNTGVSPKDVKESSLWQILEVTPHPKYYLSKTACLGILRRARLRGKALPKQLKLALEIQSDALMTKKEANIHSTLYLKMEKNQHLLELFDNHAKDCRYNGPLDVAPTIAATYGTGGNNVPLVSQMSNNDSNCILSNALNWQKKNGVKGKVFGQSDFANYKEGCSTLRAEGGDNGGGSENLAVIQNLVRRLTPLECERLQGFPDGWTNIPKASDSPRYKALGNSVAIPCVDFILQGIAFYLQKNTKEKEKE